MASYMLLYLSICIARSVTSTDPPTDAPTDQGTFEQIVIAFHISQWFIFRFSIWFTFRLLFPIRSKPHWFPLFIGNVIDIVSHNETLRDSQYGAIFEFRDIDWFLRSECKHLIPLRNHWINPFFLKKMTLLFQWECIWSLISMTNGQCDDTANHHNFSERKYSISTSRCHILGGSHYIAAGDYLNDGALTTWDNFPTEDLSLCQSDSSSQAAIASEFGFDITVSCCELDGSGGARPDCNATGKTYDEAVAICESYGYRLCTLQELLWDLLTNNEGCNFDGAYNWVSTECSSWVIVCLMLQRWVTGILLKWEWNVWECWDVCNAKCLVQWLLTKMFFLVIRLLSSIGMFTSNQNSSLIINFDTHESYHILVKWLRMLSVGSKSLFSEILVNVE